MHLKSSHLGINFTLGSIIVNWILLRMNLAVIHATLVQFYCKENKKASEMYVTLFDDIGYFRLTATDTRLKGG